MLHIKDDIYFLPDKLVLLRGENISEDVLNEINGLNIPDFTELENPRDAMSKMQDANAVNYEYCFPITGGICVSEKCQLRCTYCAFDSKEKGLSIVTMDQVKPFVNFLVSNLIMRRLANASGDEVLDIYLAGGGEPTYDWQRLVEIVEYIKYMSLRHSFRYTLGLTTNCILDEEQLKYLKDNFNLITVSFDGLPELQDKNRIFPGGTGTFKKVHHSLKYFAEFNVPVVMRSTIWPSDYCRLDEIADYVFNEYPNVTLLDVEPINSRGRAAKSKNDTIEKDYVDYYLETKKRLSAIGMGDKFVCGKFKDNVASFLCGTSYGKNPWLLPNGNVVTCIDAKDKAAVVATVHDGILEKKIFNDNILEIYLNKRESCKECFALHFCGGGCPLRYVNKEEGKNNDKECAMIRKYWMYIFNELLNGNEVLGWGTKQHVLNNRQIDAMQIWRKTWKSN